MSKKVFFPLSLFCLVCAFLLADDNYLPGEIYKYRGLIVRAVLIEPSQVSEDKEIEPYIRKLIEIVPNYDILSPASVSRSLQALYKTHYFRNIKVYARKSFDGVAVIFSFEKANMIDNVALLQLPSPLKKKINYLVAVKKNTPFNEGLLLETIDNLKESLIKAGYPDANIQYLLVPKGNNSLTVQLLFTIGKPVIITNIHYINEGRDTPEIAKLL